MGNFLFFHLPFRFVRYTCLKQKMFVHNATSHKKNLKKYQGIPVTYQILHHISLEGYFLNLEWVFYGFSFGSLVWEISSIEATCVWKTSAPVSLELQKPFSYSLGHHREIILYGWKFLFNISNGSSMEFNFITCIRSYEWICSKTSTAPKTIFWLLLNHIVIMVKVQPHKTHSYVL